MSTNFALPEKPPTSTQEAIFSAKLLLQSAGITGAKVSLEKPATVEGGLAGAEVRIEVPFASLKEALHKAAVAAAAEQGLKVTQTHLALSQAGPEGLQLQLGVEAKVFGGVLELSIKGDIAAQSGTHLRFSGLKMEGGGGMFGGIATAMIRPKLAALEASPLDLQKLAGVPLELTHLGFAGEALTLAVSFTSAP